MKCDDTRSETRFSLLCETDESNLNRLGVSVQSTTGSRGVRISGSNAGYTMFGGSVKSSSYPLHLNRREGWGASVQSTTGSRGVRISGSNAGYTTLISVSQTL